MQGYALTETCSIATVMNVKDRTIGTRLSYNIERNWYGINIEICFYRHDRRSYVML